MVSLDVVSLDGQYHCHSNTRSVEYRGISCAQAIFSRAAIALHSLHL